VYSVGEFETCAVVATRQADRVQFAGKVLPILEPELKSLVEALRIGCSDANMPYELVARELDRILLAPFAAECAGARLLALVPDGVLNNLPFAALQDDNGRFLIERHALATVPSLELLRQSRETKGTNESGAILVDLQNFGDRAWIPSSYLAEVDAGTLRELLPTYQLSALTHTKRETDRLKEIFGSAANRLNDANAQESNVVRTAAGRRYVHFSTHGLVDPYNPFQSVLVLAEPIARETGDGFLEAAEILESNAFSGTDLVTLSTCESGLGMVQGTEGVLGLTWAFLAAGSRSVVSSLWSIDDAATADLMVRFYQAVLTNRNKAESLQASALALKQDPRTAHPAYWAPFQIVGDWRNAPN
jgi:CHAT domain-containing protein